ncbi:undecaprenyl-diphosphate phosphatase [Hydrocarboniclastica marina]|uniref:Undecaprenyl-diphosphatase n=1 Tax=Hydrocarboniclastica marina TaxID=2259620 RepID=A0A4P7XD16_9ALTE|nr:undecaprenyl-diphosphate phosphatase [Hydrocarboniclastica marina]QCF24676.1 undecaprenyl-diphosphate phosphatase [Hydrocarboniclastica marina]
MTTLQILVLAIVQGLTEFLPISSSGHLILTPALADWPDQGLGFDLAVHVGTLLAVVVYFRQDIRSLASAWWKSLRGSPSADSRLAWYVVLGTVPAGLVGLLFMDFIEEWARSVAIIATTTILFGLLLGLADRMAGRLDLTNMRWGGALFVGVAQALALVPGTSRSGITITAGLFLGLSRKAAARFSFLLAIPITALAASAKLFTMVREDVPVDWVALLSGTVFSAITAFIAIHFFLKWLDQFGLWPYVWYRLALGTVLLVLLYSGFFGS